MGRKSKGVAMEVAKGYSRVSEKEHRMANPHGGYRGEGSGYGRPVELEDPEKILVTLEQKHLDLLADLEEEYQGRVRGRSAVIRMILDRYIARR